MGYFYFDESIQQRAGFIVGAFVYSPESLDPQVAAALAAHGLVPGADEFHSSTRADDNPNHASLRDSLKATLRGCRIAIVVHPPGSRSTLGEAAVAGLAMVLERNNLPGSHTAVFDQGVFSSVGEAERVFARSGLASRVAPILEADSKAVGGLQVADLIAHCCGRMLYESGAETKKMVKAGENSGYGPDLDLELEFELWADLRYHWFCGEAKDRPADLPASWLVAVEGHGLYISDACSDELRGMALSRFGRMYLGCIH